MKGSECAINVQKKIEKHQKRLKKSLKSIITSFFHQNWLCTKTLSKCYNISERRRSFMVSIFDVAHYILNKQGSMTTMKLEKLVYYSQAWSLAWDGEPLFNDDFQAWANGPVCPTLFYSHQGHYVVAENFYSTQGNIENLNDKQKETIDAVLDYYGNKDPQWLSDLTHKERPWKETRHGLAPGARCDRIISKDLMQDYYGGL